MKTFPPSLWLCAGMLAFAATALAAEPFAMPKTKMNMETCLQAAFSKKAGKAVKLEFKMEEGKPVYELEIAAADGIFEFECDAHTGNITEEEREVKSPDDPLFKAKAKISAKKAREIALKAYPGKIVETEYEIESNGDASYEFDIETDKGEVKMEVDAATGKIVEEAQEEVYQIGQEND